MDKIELKLDATSCAEFIIEKDTTYSWLSKFRVKSSNRIFVVVDDFIDDKMGGQLLKQLNKQGKEIFWMPFQSLEENKGLENFIDLVKIFEHKGLSRFDLVLGIGSGVLLDIVSFTASVYMRGVPLILVPTTLIGQVDAATAGKTCVNSEKGKNLVGTLYLPQFVYNNIRFLDTLSEYHWRQGFSEIFKYGLLGSPYLLSLLEKFSTSKSDEVLLEIIKETIKVRIDLRIKDPLSSNLGHTFGHAMEKLSDYQIGHGDAIASGTLMAIKFSELQGISREGLFDEILDKMERLKLNRYYSANLDPEDIVSLMLKDKKSSFDKINLVLISDIGIPFSKDSNPFYSVDSDSIHNFLKYYFSKYSNLSAIDLDKTLLKGI